MVDETSKVDEAPAMEEKGLLARLRSEFGFITGNFLILVLSWLVLDFANEMPSTYYPKYVQALGGTATTVGLIGFGEMMATALVQVPGGYFADKYGRRWLVVTMTFTAAFARLFYALAPSWHFVMVGAVIAGFCAIYRPALNAITMDSLPPERRGMGFSIINLIASVSTTPAPLIAGLVYTLYGLVPGVRIGYAVAFTGFLIAALMRLRLKETVEDPHRIDRRELLRAYPQSFVESVRVWKEVPRSALNLFVAQIVTMLSIGLFQPIFQFYIIDDLGISPVDFSLIMTTLFVSMIVLALPSGKLIDKVGKKRPLIAAYLLWAAASLLFVYGDFVRVVVAMTLFGLIQILFNTSGSALYADLVPKEHRGKVNGSTGFFNLIVMAAGQLLGGFLYDNLNHTMPFVLQLVLIIPPMLTILLFVREPSREEINGA